MSGDRWTHHPDGLRSSLDYDDGSVERSGPVTGCSKGCGRIARHELRQRVALRGEDPYLLVTYYCGEHAADEGCPNTTGK